MKQQDNSNKEQQQLLEQLLKQSAETTAQLQKLNEHKLIQAYNSIPRLLWFHLLKGTAFGLGSVLGATVVLSSVVYLLSQMEFIPIIGDWVSEIIKVVKQTPDN